GRRGINPMSSYIFKRAHQKMSNINVLSLLKKLVLGISAFFLLFFLLNNLFPLPDAIFYSTIVTDKKGEVINAYLTKDDKWRMKTELEEISPLLQKTILAKEDNFFYYHPGINPFAIIKAGFKNIFHLRRTSGASTITMQVARALEHRQRTFPNKIIEAFRSFQLEWKYNKKELLQLYLNLVPYGGNIEGVKAASLLYFQKPPDHLSLAEITALSIIPNRPSTLVIGKNNKLIIEERNKWLHRFANKKVFTKKEIEDALSEPLTAHRSVVPHYIPHLAYQLKKENTTGIIKTNIDLNTQLKVEKLTEDYVRNLRLKNIRNAAVIIIDNITGNVITYVGSGSFKDTTDGGQVNGAAAIRQPGSALKPLLYGLCIDEGLLTPKTIINDVPINYSGFAPENYDQKFNGAVTVEYALEHSLNIPAVKELQLLGKEKLVATLASIHFKQIEKDRNKLGLSLILGGCGTTLEQMTGLFAAFANEGVYRAPNYLQLAAANQSRILSRPATFMITEMLSKVTRPDFPLNWQATERMPKIAWKTGTSYGRKDAWSIGYNKKYTIGIWAGNFSGAGASELSGANTATPLLFKIFNTVDYNNDGDWFAPPAGCNLRQVCSETGMVPGPDCTNTILDYFIPLTSATVVCQHVQQIMISADKKFSFCTACVPPTGFIKKKYRITAPELEDYYIANNIAFDRIPSHNPDCEKIFKGGGPAITSPVNATEYFISKKNPEPLQLVARTANDVSKVYWYINDQFYKIAARDVKPFFLPEEGPVKISCTDDKGRNTNIYIRVRKVSL
ncbi:MAG: penicillin-binding protein 1C, partial [Chitinophagaceae bacterium]